MNPTTLQAQAAPRTLHTPQALRQAPTLAWPHAGLTESGARDLTKPALDVEFIALLQAYRSSGGLARGAEVAGRMERLGVGDMTLLARAIANRECVCFEWSGNFWLPWFQFDAVSMAVKDGPRRVLLELGQFLDGWELAQWFIRPEAVLAAQSPVELIDTDVTALVDAARLTRFIACG